MKNPDTRLIIRQLDKKLQVLQPFIDVKPPSKGWLNLIRKTLRMSLRQLGNRLSITPQGVMKIEKSEAEGSATINSLRETADALGLQLVYGFLPKGGSLEKIIEKRATEMANEIVMRTSVTMQLEKQGNSNRRIKEAIAEMAEALKREMPKALWD
ncbi:mobile mystery protein A [Niabella soli]|uniref:XRE family transcriptional regulator n=1 Tax=Niabella soli DSM 19437 TaxID=929713 RepID=W0F3I9_9BACT|nr:mobile mystery protein A [Niabella soli]AHF15876.1 XRE family transcriptional regulator [Niabella soli DSM 19437]